MDIAKASAKITGACFLIAMAASLVGGGLLEQAIAAPDPFAAMKEAMPQTVFGIVLEFVNAIAVIGIAATVFPFLKRRNEGAALGYFGMRILESISCVLGAFAPIVLIAAGASFESAGIGDIAFFKGLASVLLAVRAQSAGVLTPLFFCLGALIFYSLALRMRLVPKFISIWGLVAVLMVAASNLLRAPMAVTFALALPIIANEIFLGVWLLAKGFKTEALA